MMYRTEKKKFASTVIDKLRAQDRKGVVICSYNQLPATDLAQIRLSLRGAGSLMQIGSRRVLHKGFEIAEQKGDLHFNFSKALENIKGPTACVFFNEEILSVLAALNEATKKYSGQIEILSIQSRNKTLSKEEITGMSRYKNTPDLLQGIYTALTTPISSLVIFLKEYYKEILEEGTKMITKTEIESIAEGKVTKEVQELTAATFALSQGDLYSMLELIKEVIEKKFGITIGAVAAAPAGGSAATADQPEEKKDFKLKVVNVDGADKLKAAKMVQELFSQSGKPIEKLIEASKMLAPGIVFDLNPMPSDDAQRWVEKFSELGVVMEKI